MVGEELLLGPYPIDTSSDDSDSGSGRPPRSSPLTTSRSYPGALNKRHTATRDRHVEWRRVRITSLRNLRLPVRALYAGQLGTVAVEPIDTPIISPSIIRIRKGMVLADRQPLASRVMAVRFEGAQVAGAASLSKIISRYLEGTNNVKFSFDRNRLSKSLLCNFHAQAMRICRDRDYRKSVSGAKFRVMT